mmetsp:Transcript_22444/g.64489  ORF Transcript_22444/g.64489 Transcript_22444/m.64489 type:complete len:225 (+) Transcript_22444:374-1048(+)
MASSCVEGVASGARPYTSCCLLKVARKHPSERELRAGAPSTRARRSKRGPAPWRRASSLRILARAVARESRVRRRAAFVDVSALRRDGQRGFAAGAAAAFGAIGLRAAPVRPLAMAETREGGVCRRTALNGVFALCCGLRRLDAILLRASSFRALLFAIQPVWVYRRDAPCRTRRGGGQCTGRGGRTAAAAAGRFALRARADAVLLRTPPPRALVLAKQHVWRL